MICNCGKGLWKSPCTKSHNQEETDDLLGSLSEALEREPYHTCSVDEITAKLQGMTVFTIADFKKGSWMVELHPESRKLTCMVLPFGRFQWTRLPMGTVVAQDISNPSWIPSLLPWKVSQELLMTW